MEDKDRKDKIMHEEETPDEASEARRREKQRDAELAAETFAVGAAMGAIGEQAGFANLIQLAWMENRFFNNTDDNPDDERGPFD